MTTMTGRETALTLSAVEAQVLGAVAGRLKWVTFTVRRVSDRRFDLAVEGTRREAGQKKTDPPVDFIVWLPRAIFHALKRLDANRANRLLREADADTMSYRDLLYRVIDAHWARVL